MRRGWLRCCFPCSDEEGGGSRGHPSTTATARIPRELSRSRSFESHSSKSFSSRRTPDPAKSSRKALKMSMTDRERILQLVQRSQVDSQWSSPLDEDALSHISFEDVQVPKGTDAPYVPVKNEGQDDFQVPIWSLRAMVTRSRARNMQMKKRGHHLLSMSGREKIKSENASKTRKEQQLILAQAIVAKYAKDDEERKTEWGNMSKSMPARKSPLWKAFRGVDVTKNCPDGCGECNCIHEQPTVCVKPTFRGSISEKIGIQGGPHEAEAEAAPFQHLLTHNKGSKMEEIQMPEIV